MIHKPRRSSWKPLWRSLAVPVVNRYEHDERAPESPSKCSPALISNALAILELAPATNSKPILEVTLGQNDKANEFAFDMMVTELAAMRITARIYMGDRAQTLWKVRTHDETPDKPTWRYRFPRKPVEVTIASNPNLPKDNGPLRKTRRSIRRKFERSMATGRDDIAWWKKGPGRSKSWKAHRQMHMNQLRSHVDDAPDDQPDIPTALAWDFASSTVPLAYLRGHGKNPVQGKRIRSRRYHRETMRVEGLTLREYAQENSGTIRTARILELQSIARKYVFGRFEHRLTQDLQHDARAELTALPTPIKPTPRVRLVRRYATAARKVLDLNAKAISAIPDIPRKISDEMGTGDFIRLIVGIGGKTEIVSEKYLSGNVTISRAPARTQNNAVAKPSEITLSVSVFLRHDSHADVYAVHDPANPASSYEGHLFFCHGLTKGNWQRYGTRKMDRLRKSKLFVGETEAKERPLIIVTVAQQVVRPKRTDAEFPSLVKVEAKPKPSKSGRKKHKETYASVAHRGNPNHTVVKLKHPSNKRAYLAWQNRDRIRRGLPPLLSWHKKNTRKRTQHLRDANDPRRFAVGVGITRRGRGVKSVGGGLGRPGMARYIPRFGRRYRVREPEGWGLTREMYSCSAFSSSNRFAMLFT